MSLSRRRISDLHSTSASLLERIKTGSDRLAWDRFVELYTPLLLGWCQATRLPTATGDPNLAPDSDPAEILDNAEHRQYLVRRALAIVRVDFEAQTWKACWEFVVNERSAAEVSAELGISENAVYLAKSRILRHLRTELAGLLDD